MKKKLTIELTPKQAQALEIVASQFNTTPEAALKAFALAFLGQHNGREEADEDCVYIGAALREFARMDRAPKVSSCYHDLTYLN